MNRRSNKVSGFVNFPIDNPEYKSSGEGGMFVRLVVVGKEGKEWMQCCGGYCDVTYDESFIRDDKRERPEPPNVENYKIQEKFLATLDKEQKDLQEYDEFHFPDMYKQNNDFLKYNSIPYLCAMTIGSTGWSGWNDKKREYWHCTIDDLSEQGKQLYDLVQKLYPNCDLYLQTWLDT